MPFKAKTVRKILVDQVEAVVALLRLEDLVSRWDI